MELYQYLHKILFKAISRFVELPVVDIFPTGENCFEQFCMCFAKKLFYFWCLMSAAAQFFLKLFYS